LEIPKFQRVMFSITLSNVRTWWLTKSHVLYCVLWCQDMKTSRELCSLFCGLMSGHALITEVDVRTWILMFEHDGDLRAHVPIYVRTCLSQKGIIVADVLTWRRSESTCPLWCWHMFGHEGVIRHKTQIMYRHANNIFRRHHTKSNLKYILKVVLLIIL
jgi:hypothetical protein